MSLITKSTFKIKSIIHQISKSNIIKTLPKIKMIYQLLKPKIPAIDVISSGSGSIKSPGEVLCLKT